MEVAGAIGNGQSAVEGEPRSLDPGLGGGLAGSG